MKKAQGKISGKAKEFYIDLFEGAPIGYLLYDREFNLLSMNRYSEAFLITNRCKTKLMTDYVDMDSLDSLSRHVENVLKNGFDQSGLIFLKGRMGKVPVKFQSNQFIRENEILIRSTFIDLINESEKEKELSASKELAEKSNRQKTKFLADLSHEIRTPMNGITGFLHLLEESHIDFKQRDYIRNIKNSTDILLSLINDILEFSKIEEGVMKLESVCFDLRNEMENAIVPFSAKAQEKGIDLNLMIYPDVPELVISDPFRLKQTVINLISNGIKFTDNGYVLLEVKKKKTRGDYYELEFSVSDTGIGMSEADAATIFIPYSQVDSIKDLKLVGTGLGLSICKNIVELMGGKISVKSELEKGTVFTFTLLMKKSDMIKDNSLWNTSLMNRKILIADPNSLSRKILKEYLEEAGCIVTEVSSILEKASLKRSGGYQYELLIIDQEHYDEIREIGIEPESLLAFHSDIDKIPVIISMPFKDFKKKEEAEFFYRYLYKPYRRDILLNYVREAFDNKTDVRNYCDAEGTQHLQITQIDHFALKAIVADDHALNRNFLQRHLESRGVKSHFASNGEDVVSLFRNDSYDLIFMDCQMPVMDGFEATRRIRDTEAYDKHVYIVAITGNVMPDDIRNCYQAGMDECLCKPIDIVKIDQILLRANRRKSN